MKQILKTTEVVLFTSITGSFLQNIFLAASLKQILTMMNTLQIIVFHSLLSIEFPKNAMLTTQVIMQILNVDLINPDSIRSALHLDFSPEYDRVAHNPKVAEIITPQF